MKTRMPIQSAPVERTIVGAAISNQNGVDASGWRDVLSDAWNAVKTYGPTVAKGVASLL
ncbi:MAG TPA: hypothetical protein VK203_02345 [Nostocaceae cyanobacterium]|nr:hypothetical protein [Nostocaceae cyanobacterium]